MKSMKETIEEGILDDVLNLGSKFMYFWKKKWILNTKHGMERIIQRSKLKIDELKFLFKSAINKLTKLKAKAGDEFLFFSRSLQQ